MKSHRCSRCKRVKPLSAEFFGPDRAMKSGFRSDCRECRRVVDREAKSRRAGARVAKTTLRDDVEKQVGGDAQRHRDARHREALREIRVLEAKLEAVARLGESRAVLSITPRASTGTGEATAVACFSDVHVGSVVKPEQVNGLNEYNVAICRERCAAFFERVVRLTEKERQDTKISDLILFLGGDIIDGALHLDTIMSNEVAEPVAQTVIAMEIIEGGLRYLEKHGKFKRITIVCKDGNHGRITHKLHASSRTGNSLEWLLYYQLRARMPKFNWIIEHSLHTYVDVYGLILRFHHGDMISGGGLGGFHSYLNGRRHQWASGRPADVDIFGHLHTYSANRHAVSNGSVVGYNPYAITVSGAQYEPPIQAFFLVDKRRGITVTMPILLGPVRK